MPSLRCRLVGKFKMTTIKMRRRALPALAWACAVALFTADNGKAMGGNPLDPPGGARFSSYSAALTTCRFWKGGRPDQRVSPPTDPYIAGCLRRRGWTPDGLPRSLLDRLTPPTGPGLPHDRP